VEEPVYIPEESESEESVDEEEEIAEEFPGITSTHVGVLLSQSFFFFFCFCLSSRCDR